MNNPTPAIAPWYKQPWLWFILTPLIAVFIYGFFFLYLSIVTHDGIVKDDYYKIARGYEVDESRANHTRDLDLKSSLRLDMLTGDLVLNLDGKLTERPEFLRLDIVHPTHKNYDQSITLKQQPGTFAYLGSLQGHMLGKRYLILTPEDQSWRLRTEIMIAKTDVNSPESDKPIVAEFSVSQ
ncbi:MAG: FixH family protein [Pontibacterium sp.]